MDDLKYVSHVHISEPGLAPIQKRPEHKELALLLGAVGYRGFVSVEMARTDLDTVKPDAGLCGGGVRNDRI